MLGTILGLAKSGLEAVAVFLRLRERSKNEEAGAQKQREADRKKADEIQAKMDSVDPSGKSATGDRLRENGF